MRFVGKVTKVPERQGVMGEGGDDRGGGAVSSAEADSGFTTLAFPALKCGANICRLCRDWSDFCFLRVKPPRVS